MKMNLTFRKKRFRTKHENREISRHISYTLDKIHAVLCDYGVSPFIISGYMERREYERHIKDLKNTNGHL